MLLRVNYREITDAAPGNPIFIHQVQGPASSEVQAAMQYNASFVPHEPNNSSLTSLSRSFNHQSQHQRIRSYSPYTPLFSHIFCNLCRQVGCSEKKTTSVHTDNTSALCSADLSDTRKSSVTTTQKNDCNLEAERSRVVPNEHHVLLRWLHCGVRCRPVYDKHTASGP